VVSCKRRGGEDEIENKIENKIEDEVEGRAASYKRQAVRMRLRMRGGRSGKLQVASGAKRSWLSCKQQERP
jgi:hypothetical protein